MARTAASPEEPRVVVSSQVTEDVRAELERRARTGDRSLSAEIRRAIARHLADHMHEEEETNG
jgi:hypothetical protein